ncbi:MAG: cyclic pyranopterin monophosphate synthase MoaC [Oligoflexus sp.]
MADFSHLNQSGQATMVDITSKNPSARLARVLGSVHIPREKLDLFQAHVVQEICSTARIAGIQAAKQTSSLIPMCHQVPLSSVSINIQLEQERGQFKIDCVCKTVGTTGVEMEAFVAAQLAALTVYDMIKAVCPEAMIGPCHLAEKQGGKNGIWQHPTENE